jgi:hypothetical protein
MPKPLNETITQDKLSRIAYSIFNLTKRESAFIALVAVLLFIAGIVTPHPQIAMWFGFAMAGYSAIANDSIQTIGTFISSNKNQKWYWLWLFMGIIFLATVTYSWIVFDGDVSHQRLQAKGFATAPESFNFLQITAPIILLIITRMRMPVSTSILLLSAFSTQGNAIMDVLSKSLSGYFVAFFLALLVWFLVSRFVDHRLSKEPKPYWRFLQWVTSGALWSAWIMQDAANIAIFLPRSLNIYQFIAFSAYIFFGLGLLFYMKGDKIQEIVNEKSGVQDVRAATLVDLIYAIILYYFKVVSVIPMSTTWVFIGLLGGRELAISISKRRAKKRKNKMRKSFRMIGRDALFALIGLVISLILAFAINEELRSAVNL